jgi:hypothetical protein
LIFIFIQTHATSYSFCKEENEENLKENRTPLLYGFKRNPYKETSSLKTLKIRPRNLNEIVHTYMNSASAYLLYSYITISSVTVQGEHIKRSVKREGGGGQRPGEDTGGQNSDCPLERLTISLKGQQGLGCSICKVSYGANRTM